MNFLNLYIQLGKCETLNFQLYIFNIISLVFAFAALVIAISSWHKSRATYDIKKYKFPKRVGEGKTISDKKHEDALRAELESGKWEILHIYEYSHDELMIVIGKTKKN